MRCNRIQVCCVSLFLMSLLTAFGCKRPYSLESTWLDKEIVIDGSDRDWKGSRRYYDEKSNTRISIYNDSDSLYLCLDVMDPGIQMSIRRHGLTLWLCEPGKSKEVWGLRYPFAAAGMEDESAPGGNDNADRRGRLHEAGGAEGGPSGAAIPPEGQGPPGNPPAGDLGRIASFGPVSETFLIFDSEKEPGPTLSSDEIGEFGVFCQFAMKRGAGMIYEIRLPLDRSDKTPYAARLSSRRIASIGFVTGKVSRERGDGKGGMGGGPSGGAGSGGGRPGYGGPAFSGSGGGGPGGGGPGGGGPPDGGMGRGAMGGGRRVEAMKLWANIVLAQNPAPGE